MNLQSKQKDAGTTKHQFDESLFPRRVFQLPGEKRVSPGVLSIFCLPKTILSDWAGVCNLYFRLYPIFVYPFHGSKTEPVLRNHAENCFF